MWWSSFFSFSLSFLPRLFCFFVLWRIKDPKISDVTTAAFYVGRENWETISSDLGHTVSVEKILKRILLSFRCRRNFLWVTYMGIMIRRGNKSKNVRWVIFSLSNLLLLLRIITLRPLETPDKSSGLLSLSILIHLPLIIRLSPSISLGSCATHVYCPKQFEIRTLLWAHEFRLCVCVCVRGARISPTFRKESSSSSSQDGDRQMLYISASYRRLLTV